MNRFGWIILTLLFAGGVLVFRSNDAQKTSPTILEKSSVETASLQLGALPVPVVGVSPDALIDTWNQSRDGGVRGHQAIDIPAPMGTPVVATMAGRVEKMHQSERGGLTAYVRDTTGRWLTYYAHLAGYAAGLREGQTIRVGERIGFVGDTGNAGAGNTHLHFALHRMAPGERWYQGAPVNPYPLLAGKRDAR